VARINGGSFAIAHARLAHRYRLIQFGDAIVRHGISPSVEKWRLLTGSGCQRDMLAMVGEAPDEVTRVLCLGAAVEVTRAKAPIGGSVLEHVVDGGEDGSGDSHDCLLCSAARRDAVELGAQIAALLVDSRPCGLNQCRLWPGRSFAQAIGATLARTLVVARTDADSRDEMADRGKAAHVEPDLFARAQQSAQVLCRCVRDKARPLTSVLRPGTFLTCAAWANTSWKSPSLGQPVRQGH
jgi:hypothetical protein